MERIKLPSTKMCNIYTGESQWLMTSMDIAG